MNLDHFPTTNELRQLRRHNRKRRIQAAKACAEKSRLISHSEHQDFGKAMAVINEEEKKSYLQKIKDWIKGAPQRKEAKTRSHQGELKIKYEKLIEDWRIKNKYSKDSVIDYNAKKKSFHVIKGTIENAKT